MNYEECRRIIEDAELNIKLLIKRHFFREFSKSALESKLDKLIIEVIKQLKGSVDAEQVGKSLKLLANKEYKRLKVAFFNVDIGILSMIVAIRDVNTPSVKRNQFVFKLANKAKIPLDIEGGGRLYDLATPLKQYMNDYMAKVETAYRELINSKAKDVYGSHISLRNIAEMQVRYNDKLEKIQSLKDNGTKLVWISAHGNCSERCQDYQGKLYSLDGTYGAIDGIQYRPLEVATDVYVTTKSGKTYKNGCISGYNCRHYLIPYVKGNKPVNVPKEDIERLRKVEKKQREYERTVRDYKERALLYGDIDKAKARRYKSLARAKTKEYRGYCKANEIAYYDIRLKVFS